MKKINLILTESMVHNSSLLSWNSFRDLHKSEFHPRANLIKPNRPSLAPFVIPSDIIIGEFNTPLSIIVSGSTRSRRCGGFIATIVIRSRLTSFSE